MEKREKEGNIAGKINATGKMNRSVQIVTNSIETSEGDGFVVHRSFPSRSIRNIDPFLLLDEMGPLVLLPHKEKGFPDHPHRGFVTVTYMSSSIRSTSPVLRGAITLLTQII